MTVLNKRRVVLLLILKRRLLFRKKKRNKEDFGFEKYFQKESRKENFTHWFKI